MEREAYDVMDLKALRCFWAMARNGSLTRAGIELGITEAAVSARVKSLEQYLGVKLYEARGGRVRLSPAGERTLEMATGIFRELEEFERAVGKDEATATLTIATSESVLRYVLPDIVQRYEKRSPLGRLRLLNRKVEDIVKGTRSNEFDVGIIPKRRLPQDLSFFPISTHKAYVLLKKGHPLTRKGNLQFCDLLKEDIVRQYPLVVSEPDDPDDKRLEETLRRHSLPFNVGIEAGTQETMKYYVMRGLGAAVVSGICIGDLDRSQFDLIEVPSDYGGDTTYGVVMRCDKHVSTPLRTLLEILGIKNALDCSKTG